MEVAFNTLVTQLLYHCPCTNLEEIQKFIMQVRPNTTATALARLALEVSDDPSLNSAEKVDARTTQLQTILDSVSIFNKEERTERQVASTVLNATRATGSEDAKAWVSYQGLKHLAGGLQGPTGAALCAIGSDIMQGGESMISDLDAVKAGASIMDGVASYAPGVIKIAEAKAVKATALRLSQVSTQKEAFWNFFEDNNGRFSSGSGLG